MDINSTGAITGIGSFNMWNATVNANPRIKMSFYANATADIYLYASNGYVAYLGNSPTGCQLSADQATPIVIKPNRFVNTTSVLIDTVGRMGIGMDATTTTPSAMLHIKTIVGSQCMRLESIGNTEISYVHYGSTSDWYIRSGVVTGKVVIQVGGGNVKNRKWNTC